MTYKQIETSREIRLWITGILGPVIIGGATILASNPELVIVTKDRLKEKVSNITKKIKRQRES